MAKKDNQEKGFGRPMTLGEKIKCVFWSIVVVLFAIWMSSGWPLVLLPFVVDAYWTKFIPWSWWRNIENRALRELMSWVDAIVFAIVAVWVLQNFFFQNFQIPTTSLEKTMLAGDYLLVSKYDYGPRVPMTPLSLPIFQHTIPVLNCRSYIEHPQVEYRRMPGLREVQRGDIVVFNYPAGDSVMVNSPEDDYYQAKLALMSSRGYSQSQFEKVVGPVIVRPVDRRENYVKRCIGLPGETLQIVNRQVSIDGEPIENPAEMQHMYFVYTNSPKAVLTSSYWHSLGIYTKGNGTTLGADVMEIPAETVMRLAPMLGISPDSVSGQFNRMYRVNLTSAKAEKVALRNDVASVTLEPLQLQRADGIFPQSKLFHWTQSNFGPLWIPKAGEIIELDEENVALYGRCITTYEGNTLTSDGNGGYLLNGQHASTYTFRMNYYWMMGDNRDNSLDSRFWGFVPEDHIVGTPLFVWISIDPETGEWRWDRLFKRVKGL
ncbi:MAG: signal peptidase I [Bacteroidales bacterium]|nr:signal peptidase I [Bacteroidales bacterium]